MNNFEKNILNSESTIQKEDWKKDLAVAKFEYQKQKEAKKQELKRQQVIAQQKAAKSQQTAAAVGTVANVGFGVLGFMLKATLYIALAPIMIIALFMGGFAGGMIKLK